MIQYRTLTSTIILSALPFSEKTNHLTLPSQQIDICFPNLNFEGLLENSVSNVDYVTSKSMAFTFKMKQWMKFMKFVQCILSKMDHFTGTLVANTIEHVSKKELYTINF